MKRIVSVALAVLFVVAFGVSCSKGGSASGGDAPVISGSTVLDRFESMVTQMANILEGAKGDAGKAAANMQGYFLKNKEAVQQLQKDIDAFQKDPAKGMAMLNNKNLMTNLMKLSKLMTKFSEDPTFMKAMQNFQMNMFGK